MGGEKSEKEREKEREKRMTETERERERERERDRCLLMQLAPPQNPLEPLDAGKEGTVS